MEQYFNVVQDLEGNVVSQAFARIQNQNGLNDAIIYDASGAQMLNPIAADSQGGFSFAAPNGSYFIQIEVANKVYKKIGPITLYDPADDSRPPGAQGPKGDPGPTLYFGAETLYGFQNRIRALLGAKILFTGDSTTFGVALTDVNYAPDKLIVNTATLDGFPAITGVNAGQSGKHTGEWDSTYVAAEISQAPALFVVRWGANDPFYGRTISQFESSLRSGVTKIRANYPISSGVGIVLMSPNSMSDTPNGRDAAWFVQASAVVRQVALDFGCAFIDTYELYKNSRDAATRWMDNPFGDGRAIHPLETMNLLICSTLYDMLFPSLLRINFKKPTEAAPALQNGWVDYDPATRAASFYKDRNGRVHIAGIIKSGTVTSGTTIFTLPAGSRPKAQEFFPVLTATTTNQALTAGVYILTNGQVKTWIGVGAEFLNLSGISFLSA